jgi:hypothetical protein
MLSASRRDYYAGALMILLGVGAITVSRSYQLGDLSNMGPGFFPTALGVILILLGVAIAATAVRARTLERESAADKYKPEWRGWIAIASSIVAFVALGKYGGLVPASFAIAFISALGDRDNSWLTALVLGLAISAVSVVVFWWMLRLQFPLFAWG